MSYVGDPFDYDVFVSYGRANRVGKSPLRDWSVAFADELRTYLLGPRRYFASPGRELRLFFDESRDGIRPMKPLTPQVLQAAASSAILVTLMSEDYIASDWCKRELNAWDESQIALQLPGGDDRIAVARIQPTTESAWEKRLRDDRGEGLPGYWFYTPPRKRTRNVDPFGFPIPVYEDKGPFQKPFKLLLDDIHERLDTLREELETRRVEQQQKAALNAPKPLLYLHGRTGQDADWKSFRTQLNDSGFVVLPGAVDPVHKSPAEEQVFFEQRLETMRNCNALLVMSTENDPAFDFDVSYIAGRARRSLQSRGLPLLPCGLLNSVRQPSRIENRLSLAEGLNFKWFDSTKDGWTPEVRAWLHELGGRNGARP